MAKAVKTPKTNAMRELESAGISYFLHTYEDDGDESAGLGVAISEQLGEEPGQGFKTLVCVTPSNDHVVCCIPVADELDLKSAARAAGEKSLAMMHVKDLLAATGYVRGGCSPVGMKKRYRTLIDETCVLWDTIFISGGKRGYQLELAPDDLIAFCRGDGCRDYERGLSDAAGRIEARSSFCKRICASDTLIRSFFVAR